MAIFTPNHAKLGGRARGTPNRATLAARELAERLVSDEAYLQRLKARLIAGTLHPAIEQMIWAYAYGRPAEHIQLSGAINVRDMSRMATEELMAELQAQQAAIAQYLSEHLAERNARAEVTLMLEPHIDGEIVREQ